MTGFVEVAGQAVAVVVEQDGDRWTVVHPETHAFGCGSTKTDALDACAAYLRSDRQWYCTHGAVVSLEPMLRAKRQIYARLFGCDAVNVH